MLLLTDWMLTIHVRAHQTYHRQHPFRLLIPLVLVSAADRIRGWTMDEQQAWIARPLGSPQFHDCIGAVDATYVRIERPKIYADERRLYSHYKKYHAIFFMCVVDRRGTDHMQTASAREDQ